MHEIEPSGFCTIHEYRRHLEKRKQAGDISIGGLYLVLADIREGRKEQKAFKFPVRIKKLAQADLLVAHLTVDLLNPDLQPTEETAFTMEDGLATRPGLMESSTKQRINEMYVKDYEDYLDLGPGETSAWEEAHSTDLVLA